MKKIYILGILIAILMMFSCRNADKTERSRIHLITRSGKINIEWKGEVRLSGGLPAFETNDTLFSMTKTTAKKHEVILTFKGKGVSSYIVGRFQNHRNIIVLWANPNAIRNNKLTGLFFRNFPDFKQGIAYYRENLIEPTARPLKMIYPGNIPDKMIPFSLWQYKDGVYGAAVSFRGGNYSTFLGNHNHSFGCKISSVDGLNNQGLVPIMAIGFSTEPYSLLSDITNDAVAEGATALSSLFSRPSVADYHSLWISELVDPALERMRTHKSAQMSMIIARVVYGGEIFPFRFSKQIFKNGLTPLTYNDGSLINTDTPALPTEDCLFQVNEAKPFKAFSMSGKNGLLAAWNVSGADSVSGYFKPSDIRGIEGTRFAVYEYFSRKAYIITDNKSVPVNLGRSGCALYSIVRMKTKAAPIGLIDKYNSPKTILNSDITKNLMNIIVKEGGTFGAVLYRRPAKVLINDVVTSRYFYKNHLCQIYIPKEAVSPVKVSIVY